jgi:hypothetical protein
MYINKSTFPFEKIFFSAGSERAEQEVIGKVLQVTIIRVPGNEIKLPIKEARVIYFSALQEKRIDLKFIDADHEILNAISALQAKIAE